jgi:putative FmdB family regulatory protein
MPYYDLKCKSCGKIFNIKASIKDRADSLIKCTECESCDLESVYTSVNIVTSRKNSTPECPNAGSCRGCSFN